MKGLRARNIQPNNNPKKRKKKIKIPVFQIFQKQEKEERKLGYHNELEIKSEKFDDLLQMPDQMIIVQETRFIGREKKENGKEKKEK